MTKESDAIRRVAGSPKETTAMRKAIELLKSEVDYALNVRQDIEISPSKLDDFEQFLSKLSSSKGTIKEYIEKFNQNEFLPSINTEKFTELVRNLPGQNSSWGVDIAGVLRKAQDDIKQLKNGSLDFVEQDSDTVTFGGYNIKISGVAKFINSSKQSVKHIRVFALGEMIIDSDLASPGSNMTILAPTWNIIQPAIISLKGADAKEYDTQASSSGSFGESGIDGKQGQDGGAGGNFIGIGEHFIGLQQLTINVDGGNGGKGQKGGDGLPGQNSAHTIDIANNDQAGQLIEWLRYVDSTKNVLYSPGVKQFIYSQPYGSNLLNKIRIKWHEAADSLIKGNYNSLQDVYLDKLKSFTEITLKQFYEINKANRDTNFLEQSENDLYQLSKSLFNEEESPSKLGYGLGGNAGRGGKGGLGGRKGTCNIISFATQIEKWYIPQDGQQGLDGESGNMGLGGRLVLNLSDLSKSSSMCCISTKVPVHTAHSFIAPSGLELYIADQQNMQTEPLQAPNLYLSMIDYELVLGQKSKITNALSKSFCRKFKSISSVSNSITGFAEELLKLESYVANLKYDFSELYNWVARRISDADGLSQDENKALKYLYTLALTRISQLNAASKNKLVIDIDKFLRTTEDNINKLEKRNNIQSVKSYKEKYATEIKLKIEEATSFVTELVKDIEHSGNMLDEQFKKYLEEIDKDLRKAASSSIDLQTSKAKLQNAVIKTTMFGTLSVLISSAGSAFGPVGLIAAKVLQTGISMLDNPDFREHDLLVENLENMNSNWSNTLKSDSLDASSSHDEISSNTMNTLLISVRPVMSALQGLSKNLSTEKAKLAAVTTAIKQAEALIAQLQGHKEQMVNSFSNRLEEITDQIKGIHQNLAGKSIVAIKFNKLEIQNFFKAIKAEISKMTGSKSDGFVSVINKMVEALETSMTIHEHIQEYKDQITFANYIAQINSPSFKESITDLNPFMQQLDSIIARNIALEQYYSAVALVKQWSFPAAANFLDNFDTLSELLNLSDQEFIPEIKEKIQGIITSVSEEKTFIGSIDQAIKESDFTDIPFFTWSDQAQVQDLLNGKQIFLYANVNESPDGRAAIKFKEIRLKISGPDRLKSMLLNYEIEMQHSGTSYYRYSGNTYQIGHDVFKISFSFDLRSQNKTFKKIHDCSKENPFISPYTWWGIKLNPKDQFAQAKVSKLETESESLLLSNFRDELHSIQIHLVGTGQYIDENQVSQNLRVDSYYERSTSALPTFKFIEDIKPNAFNQRNNEQYHYQERDIELIQSQLLKSFDKNIVPLPPISSDQMLAKAIKMTSNEPVLFAYSLDNTNWAAIALTKEQGQIIALRNSTKNHDEVAEKFAKLGVNSLLRSEIEDGKSYNSGPLALQNLKLLAINFSKTQIDPKDIGRSAQNLREEFANSYANAVYAELESKKSSNQVTELPEFIASLNIPTSDLATRELARKIYNEKDHSIKNLYNAAQNCDPEAINTLLAKDISIDTPDNFGRTLLHWAALHDDPEAIKSLVTKGAHLEAKDNQNWTPLLLATLYNCSKALQTLISLGANKEAQIDSWTPLLLASAKGHLESTQILLSTNADKAARVYDKNALHLASEKNHTQIVELLLKHHLPIEAKNSDGWTALLLAVEQGNLNTVEVLLSHGADIHAASKSQMQAIHIASAKGRSNLIPIFLSAGADIRSKDVDGFTPLHWAAYRNHPSTITLLTQKGAAPEDIDNKGCIALHLAAQNGNIESIKLLLRMGADIHSITKTKMTSLHLASIQNQIGTIKLLLTQGVNIEANNVNNSTPLHVATTKNSYGAVFVLIKFKANIEAKDINDCTPLILAAENDGYESVLILLHHGANKAAQDVDGLTALDLAKTKGHGNIVTLLSSYPSPSLETEYQDLVTSMDIEMPFIYDDHHPTILGDGSLDHL